MWEDLNNEIEVSMLDIKKECTGCMACVNKCPSGAIGIEENEYGFVMPVIDEGKCINCGKCDKLCPIEEKPDEKTYPLEAWSMFSNSEDIVRMSSSGGVYFTLADHVIKQGGIAYGCYYDIDKRKAELMDTDTVPLKSLLTSKYVESYIGEDGLKKIEKEIKTGRRVLFCGTPCQAAGLKAYLGKDYDNLLVVDFACGGVAAQPYLRDYLNSLEERYESPITKISFRDKHYGWGQNCFYAEFENGKVYRKTALADPYYFCFLRSSMQRLACHGCHFSDDHKSDLCISDFWKCNYFDVEKNDRKGLSLALVYTGKGKQILEEISSEMHMEKLPLKEASYNLEPRICLEENLEEYYHDMNMAYHEGVEVLRNYILSEDEKVFFEKRQLIMDNKERSNAYNDIVGKGQIM